MKTKNISVILNTRHGRRYYNGRGAIAFPFAVHRPPPPPEGEMKMDRSHWCVSHLASGRLAFSVRTLKDAERMVKILSQFNGFMLPECDVFYEFCRNKGETIKRALRSEGYSFDTERFGNV
tara:strand:- start:381 stop:743 length:363 start_codon:yes stop_codon:yes gene_type:complete